jgi:hypothetical protein
MREVAGILLSFLTRRHEDAKEKMPIQKYIIDWMCDPRFETPHGRGVEINHKEHKDHKDGEYSRYTWPMS